MADSTINLILNLKGTEQAKALQEHLRALGQSLKAGAITATEYEDDLDLLAGAVGKTEDELRRMAEAAAQSGGAQAAAAAQVTQATEATERQAAALGGQVDLLGRVESAQAKMAVSVGRLEADIYEFADAFEVLESKAGAVARSFAVFEDDARDLARASDQVNAALTAEGDRLARVGKAAEQAAADHAEMATRVAEASGRINAALDSEADEAEQAAMREAVAFAKAAERHEQEMGRLVTSQGKVRAAGAATGQGMGDLQQRVTALSYAFQDFTSVSGDIGMRLNSVSNNIPGIVGGLNKWAIGISVAATAGIALYRSWDDIARAFETKNPFPGAANDIGTLTRQLDKAKEAMSKLEGYSNLTAVELARYNTLRARTVELEKQIADQQERQANYKKAIESKPADVEERKAGVAEAIQGYGGNFERDLALALAGTGQQERLAQFQKERDAQVAEIREKVAPEAQEQAIGVVQAEYARREKSIREGFDALAKTLFTDLVNGSKVAHEKVERLIRDNVAVFSKNLGPETIATFFENTPEAKQEAEHTADVMERAAAAHRQQQEIDRETQALRLRQHLGETVRVENPAPFGDLTGRAPTPTPATPGPAPRPAAAELPAAPELAGPMGPIGPVEAPAGPAFAPAGPIAFGPAPGPPPAFAVPAPGVSAPIGPAGGRRRRPRTVAERIAAGQAATRAREQQQQRRNAALKAQRAARARSGRQRFLRTTRVGQVQLQARARATPAAAGPPRGLPPGQGGGAGGVQANGVGPLVGAVGQQAGVARQSVQAQQMGLQAVAALYAENQRLSATVTQIAQAYRQLASQTEARTKTAARRVR